jgi:hypothetical protein
VVFQVVERGTGVVEIKVGIRWLEGITDLIKSVGYWIRKGVLRYSFFLSIGVEVSGPGWSLVGNCLASVSLVKLLDHLDGICVATKITLTFH